MLPAEFKNTMVQATQGFDRFGPQILRNTLRPVWFVLPGMRREEVSMR